ncbi:MAG TPA: methyltransferase domain-containing protein [Acidimicrobiales bacterium]|nr:methyltransferase domain-containing protein [Acidimicrobiales bacterium]
MGGRDQRVARSAQAYLRDVQYRDSSRLAARARLHVKWGTAPVAWFPWLATQVDWPAEAEVLEVGCGAGWMWAEAAARLPSDLDLTLTDLSSGMVREAIDRVGSLGRYRRTVGRVADAQELPFRSASFDVVMANYVLHHVPDTRRAVGEMARVLRPGGTLVVACVGDGHLAELHQIRREVFGESLTEALASTFGASAGAEELPGSFGSVDWRPYRDRLDCSDPDDVIEYLASTPPVEDASEDEQTRVVDAVRARFAAGGGRLRVSKDTGLFLCRQPRPPA